MSKTDPRQVILGVFILGIMLGGTITIIDHLFTPECQCQARQECINITPEWGLPNASRT